MNEKLNRKRRLIPDRERKKSGGQKRKKVA